MADIFISYAREDLESAQKLATALVRTGRSVFWDRTIPPGLTWRGYIGSALEEAGCVVVVWSATSVESEWVLEEAEVGKEKRNLIPVLLDAVAPPLGFRAIQALDLSAWDGRAESPEFEQLVASVSRVVGVSPEDERDGENEHEDEEQESQPGAGEREAGHGSVGPESSPGTTPDTIGTDKRPIKPEWRPRMITAGALGLAGGILAGILQVLTYANDPRRVSLWVGVLGGGAVAGVIWAVAGIVAGPQLIALVSALAVSLVFLAGWIGIFGTYQDVMAAAVIIGWPVGGIVGAWVGLEILKFREGRALYWVSRRPRLLTGLGTGLVGGILSGLVQGAIYAPSAVLGGVLAGAIWACAGIIAGPHARPFAGAVVLSVVVLAGWMLLFGSSSGVVSGAVLFGCPAGAVAGAWSVNVIGARRS